MKFKLTCYCMLAFSLYAQAETVRLSEPVHSDEKSETFGALFDKNLTQVDLKTLSENPSKHLNKPFMLQTRIAKVCQKKGCFFIAQQDQHVMRVAFKDYGFFIPTDTSGKTVLLAGELIQKERSKPQAAHFNSDINASEAVLKAGPVYEIVAQSITIPKS